MAVRVSVCGVLTVFRDGVELSGPRLGIRKARVLVAALAAARGTAVSCDLLADAVWPEKPPQDPLGNLATLASRLRKVVGDAFVVPGAASYALGRGVGLDLDTAAELVASGSARLTRHEPTLAVASASRALAVLGEADGLADECGGAWADGLRHEAAELRREARHLLAVAATATGQSELAVASATTASSSDPYDERAQRDLMSALALDGRASAALEVYAALAARLRDELGTDPDPATQRLHVALLRGEPGDDRKTTASARPTNALVGREEELGLLDDAWSAASAGSTSLVVVAGVPGIGKTRLLTEASAMAATSGGLVLATRCRPAERSLFLQPFVEVLRPVLLALPEPSLRVLLGGHVAAWARLLPELGELFGIEQAPEVTHELARRRSFDAIVAVLAGLAERQPVLLSVDDLQYGADVTADLVAHLAARLGTAPVLLLAATRTERLPALAHLTDLGESVLLGPIPPSAVGALATAAGFATRADEVQARSLGHPLSVVASLQALASGTAGVPENIAGAVAGQVELLDPESARVAGAASVLGTRVEPVVLGGLVDRPEVDVVLTCERLVVAGLMVPAGEAYDFTNDLVQEAVLAQTPRALVVAYHRRAADLVAHRPEQMAWHAHEAGDLDRAARGYLGAGRAARRAAAHEDALALFALAQADAVAVDDSGLVAGILLERARIYEARTDYEAAERDVRAAQETGGVTADARLRMRTQWMLGGDIPIARRHPLADVIGHNRAGLTLAAGLGDAVAEANFRSRLVVLDATRLRLSDALSLATAGLRESRATGFPEAIARSLDGVKAVHMSLGDAAALRVVTDELIPLLVGLRTPWLLQWALLESAVIPASQGRWSAARDRVDEALAVNRETGYGAYAGFFRAQRGWFARLAGDLDAALDDGRQAVAQTSPVDHPWWYATAVGTYAATLLEAGRPDEAGELSTAGLAALGGEAGAAYQLRCLGPLAAAGGGTLEEADRLLSEIQAPPGRAWLYGADAYETVASAWLNAGEPARAAAVVRPVLEATTRSWPELHTRARQRTSATSAAARAAPSSGTDR